MKYFKSYALWVVIAVIACISVMATLHIRSIQESDRRVAALRPLYERLGVVDSLTLALERYRRESGTFRKLGNADIDKIKDHLSGSVDQGLNTLDGLNPNTDELAAGKQVREQLAQLLAQSAKLEPALFLRDAYTKPEIVALHQSILKSLAELRDSARARVAAAAGRQSSASSGSVHLMMAAATAIVLLILSYLLRDLFTFIRPMRRLRAYALELRSGGTAPKHPPTLPGFYGEVAGALTQLAQSLDTFRRERHKFIQDVVADLKAPLSLLQAGKTLVGSGKETEQTEQEQIQAAESVRRGLKLLSGSLDDLNDVVEINRLETRMAEGVVDVSELVSDVSRNLAGAGITGQVSTTVPSMPVWAQLDPRRVERAIVLILAKIAGTMPPGRRLHIAVKAPSEGGFRGVEIVFQDAERGRSTSAATGPDQDLMKHWISDQGLGMSLVHKIIRAHGGAVTAAGVAGTSVQVTIRLPMERVVDGGLIAAPQAAGLATDLHKAPVARSANNLVDA